MTPPVRQVTIDPKIELFRLGLTRRAQKSPLSADTLKVVLAT